MNSLEMLLHSLSTEKIQVTVGTFDKIVPHDEILSESGGKDLKNNFISENISVR